MTISAICKLSLIFGNNHFSCYSLISAIFKMCLIFNNGHFSCYSLISTIFKLSLIFDNDHFSCYSLISAICKLSLIFDNDPFTANLIFWDSSESKHVGFDSVFDLRICTKNTWPSITLLWSRTLKELQNHEVNKRTSIKSQFRVIKLQPCFVEESNHF